MKRGPEKGEAYGAAAITHALADVDFPKSKKELINQYGNEEIEFKKGEPCKLREVLQDLPDQTYNSPADLEHAIHEKRAA